MHNAVENYGLSGNIAGKVPCVQPQNACFYQSILSNIQNISNRIMEIIPVKHTKYRFSTKR
jgi:hypothetical protein